MVIEKDYPQPIGGTLFKVTQSPDAMKWWHTHNPQSYQLRGLVVASEHASNSPVPVVWRLVCVGPGFTVDYCPMFEDSYNGVSPVVVTHPNRCLASNDIAASIIRSALRATGTPKDFELLQRDNLTGIVVLKGFPIAFEAVAKAAIEYFTGAPTP